MTDMMIWAHLIAGVAALALLALLARFDNEGQGGSK